MTRPSSSFDGAAGRLAAKVMARRNHGAELEAVEILAPRPTDTVLAVGIGPGVGVEVLADRLSAGRVVGIDPSAVMVATATRRNRAAVGEGRVEVVRTSADRLPWPEDTFDGVVAVNSVQLWDPLASSLTEVARVMREGTRLVALTHDWALERAAGSVDGWFSRLEALCPAAGLAEPRRWRARSEGGRSVAFEVTRVGHP